MKAATLKMILVTAGAVLFNIIFWQEKLAINALLFDAFVLWSVFYLYPAAFTKPAMKWLLLAHAVALTTVIVHNTVLSKMAFSVTLLLVVVFTQYLHRSVWYAAASAAGNYVLFIFSFIENIQQVKTSGIKSLGIRKALRFLIIPLLLAGVFFLLYAVSNAVFQNVVKDMGIALENFFSKIFDWFGWQRFGFLLLGLFVTGGLLLKSKYNHFSEKDFTQHNDMWRRKNDLIKWKQSALFDVLSLFMGRFANGIMALRNENTVGIISLLMLNVLLLFINTIDVVYVWFGFTYTADVNLKDYVHEGAGMLIFSIVLAMMVLLFFFRGNLNFYKKNKWRYGAYGWIIQNAVLVISVLLRDYYYIEHMGLAYKRIGVLVFLTMVLMGLITVFIKIHQKKTAYYLLRVNGWFAIILLVAASCIHWDETIASYNLARKNTIPVDVKFLLTLSDKTLPLLEQNPDVLDSKADTIRAEGEYLYRSALTPRQLFEERKRNFVDEQKKLSWLSWNVTDAYVKNQLIKTVIISSLNE
jgi:Domain of unknown function (DUF4173)